MKQQKIESNKNIKERLLEEVTCSKSMGYSNINYLLVYFARAKQLGITIYDSFSEDDKIFKQLIEEMKEKILKLDVAEFSFVNNGAWAYNSVANKLKF